jgi:hypothetical protein
MLQQLREGDPLVKKHQLTLMAESQLGNNNVIMRHNWKLQNND